MRRIAALAITTGLFIAIMPQAPAQAQAWRERAKQNQEAEAEKADQWLELVFGTGRVVFGQLVEETDDAITVMVHIEGFPPTKATFEKNEIIEFRRNLAAPGDGSLGGEDEEDAPVLNPRNTEREDFPTETATGGPINDETTKFYFASINGDMGSAVTATLLERYFEDIDETFNDLIEVPNPNGTGTITVVDPEKRDQNIVVFALSVSTREIYSFGFVESATRGIGNILEDQMDIRGRRVIFVIDSITNGACFLMFTCPEVYFEPDAEMIGYGLADLIGQGADEVVREKWIGITLAAMTSIANANGYGETGSNVVSALARQKYWFAYQMDGDKAITILDEPDNWDAWTILSDDGEDDREDSDEVDPNENPEDYDIAGREVNPADDHLEINAEHARRLGLSKGTVSNVEDLAFALGVQRNYVNYASGRAFEIANKYFTEVSRVNDRIEYPRGDLWRDFEELEEKLGRAEDGREQIQIYNKQIQIIRQVMSSLSRYSDVNFQRLSDRDMELMIEERKQAIRRIRNSR